MFPEKNALKNFANFAGKHLYWSRFLIKLQAFMRFLRISFFAEHLLWLAGSVDFRLDKRRQIALAQKLLSLHKKWSFSLTIFSVNVTFTEEILNGKLQFLCSVFFFSAVLVSILILESTRRRLKWRSMILLGFLRYG